MCANVFVPSRLKITQHSVDQCLYAFAYDTVTLELEAGAPKKTLPSEEVRVTTSMGCLCQLKHNSIVTVNLITNDLPLIVYTNTENYEI